MGFGDEEFDGLNGIIGELGLYKDVVSNVGARGASVEILKW